MKFSPGTGGAAPKKENIIDSLIDAAGGAPLPGKWGVAQAVANIWSSPPPAWNHLGIGMWATKNALSTAGVIRAYNRQQTDGGEVQKDELQEWLDARELRTPAGMSMMAQPIHSYLSLATNSTINIGRQDAIRRFTTKSGVDAYFSFRMYNPQWDSAEAGGGLCRGHGPYVHPSSEEAFRSDLAELAWTKHAGDVEVQMKWDDGRYVMEVNPLGPAGDYIGDETGAEIDSLVRIANRCKAFGAAGMQRRIMLNGPPGTGKSTLARRLARELDGYVIRIHHSALDNGMAATMDFVNLLRPAMVLIDDLDRVRSDEQSDLLHYLENHNLPCTVCATVNALELDPALLRPGRFDEVISVDEPSDAQRGRIVAYYVERFSVPVDAAWLTDETKGMSPADIREILACISAVGVEYLEAEIERVRLQRGLYAGGKVAEFLGRRK